MSQPDSPPVLLELEGPVAVVTLNRPERRNAIDSAMRTGLAATFDHLDADSAVSVVVLTGAGAAFCAGADLKEVVSTGDHPLAAVLPPITAPLDRFRKPIIAAVNGPAVGGGFELVLACDLRIASVEARFALTEVRIGSLPGSGGIQRLVRAVPQAVAAQLVLASEPLSAEAALRVGLVTELTGASELMPRARAIATRIAEGAPLSLLAAKQSLRAAGELSLSAGLQLDRLLWGWLSQSLDRAEGRAAFRERRRPKFVGR